MPISRASAFNHMARGSCQWSNVQGSLGLHTADAAACRPCLAG